MLTLGGVGGGVGIGAAAAVGGVLSGWVGSSVRQVDSTYTSPTSSTVAIATTPRDTPPTRVRERGLPGRLLRRASAGRGRSRSSVGSLSAPQPAPPLEPF